MPDFPTALTSAVDGNTDVLAKHLNNVEAKIGIDGSAVTTSHDYKLSLVTSTNKAVPNSYLDTDTALTANSDTKIATQKATKAYVDSGMTSPIIATSIDDSNNNELLKVTATAGAVNELTLANAATGSGPTLSATGGDTNIDVNLSAKGTGSVLVDSNIKVRAYLNSAQDNLKDATFVKVLLDAESYDPGSYFASNKFTAPKAGTYLVTCQVAYQNVVANKRYHAAIYKNGVIYSNSNVVTPTTDTFTVHHSDILDLAANDYVELFARADAAASTVDLITGATNTALAIHLLSV